MIIDVQLKLLDVQKFKTLNVVNETLDAGCSGVKHLGVKYHDDKRQ